MAEVASVGGFVKQYQVIVDPTKLRAYGVALGEVVARGARARTRTSAGAVLEIAGHEHMVRGRGYVQDARRTSSASRSRSAPAASRSACATWPTVALGPAPRRGFAELDGQGEAVGGIVVMRYGENALEVIDARQGAPRRGRASLPEGVEVVITYDRSG